MGKRAKKQAPQTSKFLCRLNMNIRRTSHLSPTTTLPPLLISLLIITEKKPQLARRFKCPFCANGTLVTLLCYVLLLVCGCAVVIANHLCFCNI